MAASVKWIIQDTDTMEIAQVRASGPLLAAEKYFGVDSIEDFFTVSEHEAVATVGGVVMTVTRKFD